MKLNEIYRIAVEQGMKMDLRSKKDIDDTIKNNREEYKKAKGVDKAGFDMERLKNPYDDTRILNGSGSEEVRDVMVGIDIGVEELVLADRLIEKGINIDLVVSHHPSGRALSALHKVMRIQSDIWVEKYGFKREVAEGMMRERVEEVSRGLAPANNTKVMDAAKLLGIPFMCTHTVADNCVAAYLQKIFDAQKPKKLKNVLGILKNMPEYKDAVKHGVGPDILIGKEDSSAGRIFVDMTGGTSGPSKLFARLHQAGVNTIIGMHCKEQSYKIAKTEFINYVIAGHMASDNVGMNLLFDAVEKRGKLNFIECSGFRRFRRK